MFKISKTSFHYFFSFRQVGKSSFVQLCLAEKVKNNPRLIKYSFLRPYRYKSNHRLVLGNASSSHIRSLGWSLASPWVALCITGVALYLISWYWTVLILPLLRCVIQESHMQAHSPITSITEKSHVFTF